MFAFERFGGFNNKRKHVVQFKTRDKALSPAIIGVPSPKKVEPPTITASSSISSDSSLNITDPFEFPTHESTPHKKPVEVEEEEEEDDIFNFPDTEEHKEIKLMVASNRAIPENHSKKTGKKSKSTKKKTQQQPIPKKSSSNESTSTKKSLKVTASKKKMPERQPLNNRITNDNTVIQPNSFMNSNNSFSNTNSFINNNNTAIQPNNFTNNNNRTLQPNSFINNNSGMTQPNSFINTNNTAIQPNNNNNNSGMIQPNSFINPNNNNNRPIQPNTFTNNRPTIEKEEEDSIFDIFDFDFNPTVHIRHNSTLPQLYNVSPSYNTPMTSIDSILNNNVLQQEVNEFLNENTPPTPIKNVEKKRKRNLVAHLKSASGEQQQKPTHQGFDFLSDEEELLNSPSESSDIIPFREFIQKERSMSPELTYKERMELELENMMKTESDVRKSPEIIENSNRRPRYQPQNKLNVKFTFERKKK